MTEIHPSGSTGYPIWKTCQNTLRPHFTPKSSQIKKKCFAQKKFKIKIVTFSGQLYRKIYIQKICTNPNPNLNSALQIEPLYTTISLLKLVMVFIFLMTWIFKIPQYQCHLNNVRNTTLFERRLFSLLHCGEDTSVCVTKRESSEAVELEERDDRRTHPQYPPRLTHTSATLALYLATFRPF